MTLKAIHSEVNAIAVAEVLLPLLRYAILCLQVLMLFLIIFMEMLIQQR